jgi:hypothetical protein
MQRRQLVPPLDRSSKALLKNDRVRNLLNGSEISKPAVNAPPRESIFACMLAFDAVT